MAEDIKKITCDPACGFEVQSHDEEEVLELAAQHVAIKHQDMNVNRVKLIAMMKTIPRPMN
ncbi:hypothetical protein A2160_04685 [Candidatus Beckwithbacteria bacterium RBG_13_42_9]|uniref:DUF1059 domain-containing protein n=1 Tax=Candidatus Beckwithbacteria bacterium RBG_13_42_9 TaxID=1797457 RepID=A0A1F5E373_9BACT|nr:MAG: hypothetical protein A2160_04685 [Candidatus Beckwithbacteria bacterium RBG_13_42_9]